MDSRGNGGLIFAVLFGVLFAVSKTFRLLLAAAAVVIAVLFFWDKFSEREMEASEYTLTIDEPQFNDLGGIRPVNTSPLFTWGYRFKNNSDSYAQDMTLLAEMFSCPTPYAANPDEDCDFVESMEVTQPLDLAPGRSRRDKDRLNFTRGVNEASYVKVVMTVLRVRADGDVKDPRDR